MPTSLIAKGVSVAHGAHPILRDVSVTVAPGERLGVVGPNGVGKTTLLRVLAGELGPDRGSVQLLGELPTRHFVPQTRDADAPERAMAVLRRRSGVARANEELVATERALAADPADPKTASAYAEALERWLAVDGGDFERRVLELLDTLELDRSLLDRPMGQLSGGQAARVALGGVLLSRADLVLLDEPTNDLDFAGLALLERFLRGRSGSLIVVSHDRAFLEGTVTAVLELDEHTHAGTLYRGGWVAYLEERAIARRHGAEDYASYLHRRDDLERRAQRQREWAVQGRRNAAKRPRDNDRAQRGMRIDRTEKQASKVRSSERALERLVAVEKPYEGWQLHYHLESTARSGDLVFVLENALVRRGAFELGPINVEVRAGDRIGVVGPNGAGKSTLVDVLVGRLAPEQGRAVRGPSVVIGDLGQTRADLESDRPLEEAFAAAIGGSPTKSEVRSLLAKFRLGAEHVRRPTRELSPGERTRASLARFMATGANTLVLDEPTNHLDLEAIEELEDALGAWHGTLILVTHDRRLLHAVALDRLIAPDGTDYAAPAVPLP